VQIVKPDASPGAFCLVCVRGWGWGCGAGPSGIMYVYVYVLSDQPTNQREQPTATNTEEIEAVFKSGGGADQVITQAILKVRTSL
jgi:hypothetical protein